MIYSRIQEQIRELSSGTIASISGHCDYETIDMIRDRFLDWHEREADWLRFYENWQTAWVAFATENGAVSGSPATAGEPCVSEMASA